MQNLEISVLTCGINQLNKRKIEINIAQTIGTTYEFLYYDNSIAKKSISYVYNLLKSESKGSYLCFVHDDVCFLTENWGQHIKNIFLHNLSIGLVGVAGSQFKSKTPSTWSCIDVKFWVCNYIQHFKNTNQFPKFINYNSKNDLEDVVFIDGFFMCVNDNIKHIIQFDEQIITNFHGYDFDISMQTLMHKKRICVTNKILIEHFSEGSINEKWYMAYKLLCKKYKNWLPLHTKNNSFINNISLEYSCFYSGYNAIKKHSTNKYTALIIYFINYFNLHFLWYYFYKNALKQN